MKVSSNAAAYAPLQIQQWGNAILWGGLISGLFIIVVLVWAAPKYLPFLPLFILGAVGLATLFRYPTVHLSLLLCGSVILANYQPGFQIEELIYGIYFLSYLFIWYIKYFSSSEESLVDSSVDFAVLIFVFVSLPLGLLMCIVFQGNLSGAISETVALSFVAFYFPLKKLCRDHKYGIQIVGGILLWFSVYFTVWHVITYYGDIQSAQYLWQIVTERFYGKEMPLLTGALVTLVGFLYFTGNKYKIISFSLFSIFFASLILTRSRGYWIDLILGIFFLFCLQNRKNRTKILTAATSIFTVLILSAWFFFGDFAIMAFSSIIDRFSTIKTSITDDVSLVNRFYEWKSMWEYIKMNPIIGYGLGTPYVTFDILRDFHMVKSFSHNAFLSLWYRLGILGVGCIWYIWTASIYHSTKIAYRKVASRPIVIVAIMTAVCLVGLIPAAHTSNPFHRSHEILIFVVLVAWVAGLRVKTKKNMAHEPA